MRVIHVKKPLNKIATRRQTPDVKGDSIKLSLLYKCFRKKHSIKMVRNNLSFDSAQIHTLSLFTTVLFDYRLLYDSRRIISL